MSIPANGTEITIKVGGQDYKTVMINGVQRFVTNHTNCILIGMIDLNKLALQYEEWKTTDPNRFTQRMYAEFMMSLGMSVSAFCDLHAFVDMDVENPLWDT